MLYTNNKAVSLPVAVWCVDDTYDNNNTVSATTLLKPVRQIVLGKLNSSNIKRDLIDFFAAMKGTAIHNAIEDAWIKRYKDNLKKLGYPDSVIDKIRINPEEDSQCEMPIYIEKRLYRNLPEFQCTVSGQIDMIIDGQLYDFKTSTVAGIKNDDTINKYTLQGAVYMWLDPERKYIKNDSLKLEFILTDWSKAKTENPNYPQSPFVEIEVFPDRNNIQQYIENKLRQVNEALETNVIPECSPEDLWLDKPKFKYYSSYTATKALKVFDTFEEANAFMLSKGKGFVKEVQGTARRCKYCPVHNFCTQKNNL